MVGLPHPANFATASIVKRVGPSLASTSVAAAIIAWCSTGLRRFPVLGEQKPTFFEPWEKVDSAKLDRKQTKTDLVLDQEERWLGEESEK